MTSTCSYSGGNGTTTAIKRPSPLTIPPELRLLIYGYLFSLLKRDLRMRVSTFMIAQNTEAFPGFMRTCTLLRKEAAAQYSQYLRGIQSICVRRVTRLSTFIALYKADVAGIQREKEYEWRRTAAGWTWIETGRNKALEKLRERLASTVEEKVAGKELIERTGTIRELLG